MKNWRFLDTGANNAFWNMAIDEAIFLGSKKKSLPTLRFYRWKPAAVSIGYAQNVEKEVDLKECKNLKVDVVRRWTGGGAIFHDDELTYSFVSRTNLCRDFDDLLASYKQVCQGIIDGLFALGISVKFREEKSRLSSRRKVPCFMASSRHDLIVGEKKVMGNAQRRTKELFLQQGSLPLAYDFNLINRVFPGSDGFKNMATSISQILHKKISFAEIKEKILFGFAHHFSVNFKEGTLSAEEQLLAKKLFEEKYSSKKWTFKR